MKAVKTYYDSIEFEDGVKLFSYHDNDCCESHYLYFGDLVIEDFDELEFDFTNDNFFKRIPNYGIELIPIHGHSIKIPGYAHNNGFYSDQLDLILEKDGK